MLHCTLCLACAWWRCSGHPSYRRWSEAANAVLRASSQLLLPLLTQHAVAGFAVPRQSTRAAALAGPRLGPPAPSVDALHSAAASAMASAQHVALLLWASGAPAALGCTLGWRVRFRWGPCVGWVQEGWRCGKEGAA